MAVVASFVHVPLLRKATSRESVAKASSAAAAKQLLCRNQLKISHTSKLTTASSSSHASSNRFQNLQTSFLSPLSRQSYHQFATAAAASPTTRLHEAISSGSRQSLSLRTAVTAMAPNEPATSNGPVLVEGGGPYDFDLVTIGIGSGGTRASRIASSLGAKVAAIELPFDPVSSDTAGGVGGTCVLRGCVPKKILVYGSAFKAEFEDAAEFGWNLPGTPTFDWKKLLQNKTNEIERLNGVYKRLLTNAKVTMLEGRGRVLGPHSVEVTAADGSKQQLSAKYILVAVGGTPQYLDIPGKEFAISSDQALSLEEQPKRVVIVGSGYIAVEFAGIFSGMGSEVDLMFRQPLPLRGFDDEMRQVVASNLSERGIRLHPTTLPTKIEKLGNGSLLVYTSTGQQIEADAVMMATGRVPKTRNLGLEEVGVELDKQGAIKVSEYSQTNIPSIWAVGDVTNRINLTPVALMEGQCFAHTVFGSGPMKPDFVNVASAVFCQPPLAVVGLSEEQALEVAENDVWVYTSSFTPMKNTISKRKEKTIMKLLVDSVTDKILGVSMCGPDAPEIMQSIGITMKMGVTKKDFDSTVGIHPTAAEEFVTMRTPTRKISPKKPALV